MKHFWVLHLLDNLPLTINGVFKHLDKSKFEQKIAVLSYDTFIIAKDSFPFYFVNETSPFSVSKHHTALYSTPRCFIAL